MFLGREISIPSLLSLACAFSIVLRPCAGADFDAKSKFAWIDSSCDKLLDRVNNAGDDYTKLVQAGLDSVKNSILPPTNLGKLTLRAYLGADLGVGVKGKFTMLQTAFDKPELNLYCDGSAFEWKTEYQEGPKKGQPLVAPDFPNNGAWHSKEGRYNPNMKPLYIKGEKTDQRKDFCQDTKGNDAQGVSEIGGTTVVLCPDAFKDPIKETIPTTKQNDLVKLQSLESTGSVLFHEMTHVILSTIDLPAGYGALGAIKISANPNMGSPVVQSNAENWLFYAMALYLKQNAWVLGVAQDTTRYADPAAPAKRQLPSSSPVPTSSPTGNAVPIPTTSGAQASPPASGPPASTSLGPNSASPTAPSNTPSNPPAGNAPSSSSTTVAPPIGNPPSGNPPSGNPPSGNPPSNNPPSNNPPSNNPPSNNPPSNNPPSNNPPSNNPPSNNPPSNNPPSNNPPSNNPPSNNPPSNNPPSNNPPSNNPPSNNPPSNNPPDDNQKSQSKQDSSATSSSPSTTSSPSSSTSSTSSADYNIQSGVIYVESSDTIGYEAITAAIASEASALTITFASGSPTPTTLVTSTSKLSCMGVENPKFYDGASLVCSCNDGKTYATMATPANAAGPCAFTTPPPSPVASSDLVPDPTPTTSSSGSSATCSTGDRMSLDQCKDTCPGGMCVKREDDKNRDGIPFCRCHEFSPF